MIVRLLRRLLGIRSPSRVVGESVAAGIRAGVASAPPVRTDMTDEERLAALGVVAAELEASGTLERARRVRDVWFPDDA